MDWAKWAEGIALARALAEQGYAMRAIYARVKPYGVSPHKVRSILDAYALSRHGRGRVGYAWLRTVHPDTLKAALDRVQAGDYDGAKAQLAPILGYAPSELTLRRWLKKQFHANSP